MNAREFLFRRKNRCVGRILGQLERDIFPALEQFQRDRVTALIKNNIGNYHSEVLDVYEDGTGTVYNPISMELQDRLNDRPTTR